MTQQQKRGEEGEEEEEESRHEDPRVQSARAAHPERGTLVSSDLEVLLTSTTSAKFPELLNPSSEEELRRLSE